MVRSQLTTLQTTHDDIHQPMHTTPLILDVHDISFPILSLEIISRNMPQLLICVNIINLGIEGNDCRLTLYYKRKNILSIQRYILV